MWRELIGFYLREKCCEFLVFLGDVGGLVLVWVFQHSVDVGGTEGKGRGSFMEALSLLDSLPESGQGDGSDVDRPGSCWGNVHGCGLSGAWGTGCGASWGDKVDSVFLPVNTWVVVAEPWNPQDQRVVA